ncbi:MAG: alpha/beta fold hydrolase [Rothia sp. (in: high G+C Gram-positive bacteria)]|nr:alpha/beta fold hydrolase [Rothia sp. (in: high G+C Gram-positive bacteria)]
MVQIQDQTRPTKTWKPLTIGAACGATLATIGLAGSAGFASYFARRVVVPPKKPLEDVRVHSLGYSTITPASGQQPSSITIDATDRTRSRGNYGFYFSGGAGFALLGEVVSFSPKEQTVTREILKVTKGDISDIERGRLSGVVAPTPQEAGYAADDIELDLPVGTAPAWLVRPGASLKTGEKEQRTASSPGSFSETWAIMIHGMGATRAETLRALDTTQALGLTSLHMSYRNDREAPASEDGRYGLGFTEWQDVDIAIDYALAHGAKDVVLFGWSMGGAISLRTADKARNRRFIRALVLDGPAVDWVELMRYHTQLNKVPMRIGQLGVSMITHPMLNVFSGLKEPIHLDEISWPHRARDISVPTLIMHSLDDTFVPVGPSQELACKSSLVDFVPFKDAAHTREWNVDPDKWQQTVLDWLGSKLG